MNVIDLSEIRVLRRPKADERRAPTYIVVMVENLSAGELAHRPRGSGLSLSNRSTFLVLHESKEPPPAA